MKRPLDELRPAVDRAIARFAMADKIRNVRLEEGEDDDGSQFIRVILSVTEPDAMKWNDLAPLVREIEDEVEGLDERFPSVRLAQAA